METVAADARLRHRAGGLVDVAVHVSAVRPIDAPLYLVCQYDDITARRAMEDALRNSEAHFRQVVDSAIRMPVRGP